jgi:hypothetical protein
MSTNKSTGSKTTAATFVMCISNENYPASLELWKVYRVMPDAKGDAHGLIRVVDESGEDYLYPAAHFVPIRVPIVAQKAMRLTAG